MPLPETTNYWLYSNDNFKGGKFYLVDDGGNRFYPEMKAGSIIIFPSYLLHGCEPITRGTRHAVVAWMEGPEFR
jgi:PKHD-type hydroxylase